MSQRSPAPVLLLDIGNTRAKGALWHGPGSMTMLGDQPPEGLTPKALRHVLTYGKSGVRAAVVAASGPTAPWEVTLAGLEVSWVRVGVGPLPFAYTYLTPRLGADRIAGLAWAAASGDRKMAPMSIVLAGTCITVDTLNWVGGQLTHMGGSISPGLTMRMKAMHHGTAGLPLIDLPGGMADPVPEVIAGWDTASCLVAGGVGGAALEVWGRVHALAEGQGLNRLEVFISGGDGALLHAALQAGFMPTIQGVAVEYVLVENLVLKGLGVLADQWGLLGAISENTGPGV